MQAAGSMSETPSSEALAAAAGPVPPEVSILVPVFNEAATLGPVLSDLLAFVEAAGRSRYEIIVIDDGSTDGSRAIAEAFVPRLRVESHERNCGYGAALVTGGRAARGQYLAFFDADGQHTPAHLQAVLSRRADGEMVVGARRFAGEPLWRRLGRRAVHRLAGHVVRRAIPDLNSGLRVVERHKFLQFAPLYPRGFSLTTTLTLAFFQRGYSVAYVPIDVQPRKCGRSRVRLLSDGWRTLGVVVRLGRRLLAREGRAAAADCNRCAAS